MKRIVGFHSDVDFGVTTHLADGAQQSILARGLHPFHPCGVCGRRMPPKLTRAELRGKRERMLKTYTTAYDELLRLSERKYGDTMISDVMNQH